MAKALERLLLTLYSLLLTLALAVSAPWWGWRMLRGGRYREGLAQRLGFVPGELRATVAGKDVVWVHAVSVGEVLAAERLVAQLKQALPGWVVAVSTTTATGQKIARERLAGSPVFYFPLDFAWTVRAWLRVLRPKLMVLVESEFWPRHLHECERAGVPVAVVNARVSDRSFPRYMRLRWFWRRLFAKVRVFLAQGEESAERLRAIGADRVQAVGNLKYDLPPLRNNAMVTVLRPLLERRRLVVAGSLLEGEEERVLKQWLEIRSKVPEAVVLIAPRHPERFEKVASIFIPGLTICKATDLLAQQKSSQPSQRLKPLAVILLNTVGDLAAVYQLAGVALIGGSLSKGGGHNPLEAARFGVPIVMGPSYENFREVVEGMRAADAIRVVAPDQLTAVLVELLQDDGGMGERGSIFFQAQSGATERTIEMLVGLTGVPQRLKPHASEDPYGTAEAEPLSEAAAADAPGRHV